MPQHMDKQKKPPVPTAPVRKRKKGSEPGPAAAAAAGATSPPPAAKKARVAAPKAKASKADKAQEDAAEPSAREDARGGGDAPEEERLGKLHTGVFSKDLPWLMYGFGDADKPLKESVDLVEEIAMQYITDTVHTAMRAAAARSAAATGAAAARRDELKLEDVLYAVRRDPRKVARIQELIRRQQDIENAKRLIKADDDMPTEL